MSKQKKPLLPRGRARRMAIADKLNADMQRAYRWASIVKAGLAKHLQDSYIEDVADVDNIVALIQDRLRPAIEAAQRAEKEYEPYQPLHRLLRRARRRSRVKPRKRVR